MREETKCDKCDRKRECYAEGRLITYTTSFDLNYENAYGGKAAHGIIGVGETCPRKGADE